MTRTARPLAVAATGIAILLPAAATAATITGWNKDNVQVGADVPDGETGYSVIYDGPVAGGGTLATSGRIAYSPPEADPPGIKVQPQTYVDTGDEATLTFDGCLMTSNTPNLCTGEFQSGKRIKQLMTGFDPVDLVFDVNSDTTTSFYQVFGRLINATGSALGGFTIELGQGVGGAFTAFGTDAPVTFSFDFTAQPNSSGQSSTTQFPFGLFGAAADSPNFLLDGFFASARTGLDLVQTDTKITSTGYFGDYFDLFGAWNPQLESSLPQGLFWDFDGLEDTDALLMAWLRSDGLWELRRDVGITCDPADAANCTFGVMRTAYETGTLDEILGLLNVAGNWTLAFSEGAIEDLANLNVNYALEVGNLAAAGLTSFTLRTTVHAYAAPIPLPAGAPLLLGALGALGLLRRRARAA